MPRDNRVTHFITIKKVSMKIHQKYPQKSTQKMSTKSHWKRGLVVDILSTRIHQKCPWEFTHFVNENFYDFESLDLEIRLLKNKWKICQGNTQNESV